MSELIVLGYDDRAVANRAFDAVQKLEGSHVIELTGLAIVSVDADGKTHVDTPARRKGEAALSATAGALWGMVFGMIILTPGIGVVGAAVGGLIGKLNQMGVDNKFRDKVQSLLAPGSSAVVVMASKVTEDKFAAAVEQFGGTVLKTSLSEESERELAEQLAGTGSQD
ncbi:DUF1269 domain-containing protein [Streptomyces sp. NBC_00572]|uniref:DUF1269 domain-containing protein n=1 Tax=Streptomyces sp. NBC_00572 TaxID=2903664 RepID=UPI002255FB20|nr:DUF1269 domain-containing protein [Streptomyces sp. NBC_00572]MCX4985305.1 DUF1269 domain-containing protein [Streptomyces sp. NBC_00572]